MWLSIKPELLLLSLMCENVLQSQQALLLFSLLDKQ